MTYENALGWLTDNLPKDMYDNYDDWYNACRQEIQTPALWDSISFTKAHRDYWNSHVSEENISTPEYEEPIQEPIYDTPSKPEPVNKYETIPTQKRPYRKFQQQPIEFEYNEIEQTAEIQEPVLPPTGSAPVISMQRYDMTQPKQKESFFKRVFRNPFRRNK